MGGYGSGGFGLGGYGLDQLVVTEDVNGFGDDPGPAPLQGGEFRPPQWNVGDPQTMVIVPAASSTSGVQSESDESFTISKSVTEQTQYVFDAVLRLLHEQQLQMTQHPVQSGANVVDHAYLLPAKLSLEVGFSDAMDAFTTSMYTTAASKSVSAFQTFLELQAARVPLTIKTRLKTYDNMLIESISAPDDFKTKFGLKANIALKQIILATNNAAPQSARPDATDSTPAGTKAPEDPSATLTDSHQLTNDDINEIERGINAVSTPFIQSIPQNIPGAGKWSSNSVSSILPSGPQ